MTDRKPFEPLSTALARAVEALEPDEQDAAAVRLAELYARQIDQAGATAAVADRALRKAGEEGDETLVELVNALRAKLGEREALDRIGARLHALLVELQATPKARSVAKGSAPVVPAASRLRGLRAAT